MSPILLCISPQVPKSQNCKMVFHKDTNNDLNILIRFFFVFSFLQFCNFAIWGLGDFDCDIAQFCLKQTLNPQFLLFRFSIPENYLYLCT